MIYKDFTNYDVLDDGRIWSKYTNKFLTFKVAKNGYLQCTLTKDKKHYGFLVHRVIAQCYIPNPNNLETVDHINNDKTDNRVENLRWMTRRENTTRAVSRAVLCVETGKTYLNAVEAGKETGIHFGNIRRVCKGDKYRKRAGGFQWKFI